MRLFLVNFAALAAVALFQIRGQAGDDVLKDKIVRATLNHNQPALVLVGTQGVTSLEFPYKIEAIDGFGFSQAPGSGDAFQISYTKGTNYFSVRALKPEATGNLTVVLDQKVYSFFFEESSNPSFVNIFGPGSDPGLAVDGEREIAEKNKVATPVQLAALLKKIKGYGILKTSSPDLLDGLQVAEPGKKLNISNEVESIIRRVLKDDALGSVALEVEINNKSTRDFWYDPQGLQVKVKGQVFEIMLADAPGMVPARTSISIFLMIGGTGPDHSDLSVDSDFDLVVKEGAEAKSAQLTFNQPPGDYLPTAITNGPPVPDTGSHLGPDLGANHPQAATSTVKRAAPPKPGKKPDSKPGNNSKESLAKTQKPSLKKLFGWL